MSKPYQEQLDLQAVNNFCEYLRIPSVHPNVDYDECIKFLGKQAKSLNLPMKVFYVDSKKPIAIITWKGTDTSLPSILLNSHMDVVPAYADHWTYPPFSAHLDDVGNIYARGSQDMKCVGIQYLEAIRQLMLNGARFKRSIHVSFMPEEEVGGVLGMKDFIKLPDFHRLNVCFALDEGIANPTDSYSLFYGERTIWHVKFVCPGNPGHGSLLIGNTAAQKFHVLLNKFMNFRDEQQKKLDNNLKLGNVTSVNLTKIKGGVQSNVIPNEIEAVFDIRLDPETNHANFEKMLNTWCTEAGEGVYFTFEEKNEYIKNTELDESNQFWVAFKRSCDQQNIKLDMGIFPGGTDSRYIRSIGIPAIGFSPINNTKILLHDHDEHLNVKVFLRGIQIYKEIIRSIANA